MAVNLDRVVEEIVALSPHDKVRLLERLRSILAITPEDWARLKLAEGAFDFWENESDAAYDDL